MTLQIYAVASTSWNNSIRNLTNRQKLNEKQNTIFPTHRYTQTTYDIITSIDIFRPFHPSFMSLQVLFIHNNYKGVGESSELP